MGAQNKELYNSFAELILLYGDKITMHKHVLSEPHSIYYMYFYGFEIRYSFGSHGTYGVSIDNPFKNIKGALCSDGFWWEDYWDDVSTDLPDELLVLVNDMKKYFKDK